MSILRNIRLDIEAALQRDPAARNAIDVIVSYPGFHARELHRLAHSLYRARLPVLPRLISNLNRFLTGIEIHPGARIGSGLFIDHGMGVVIGETAVIGDNCTLRQEVTLGGTSTRHEKRHPTLADNVDVGAGAKLIGAIVIGEHARIGAGSVVVTNVPAYATVVGVPGRVVAYYDPGDDTTVRLPDPEWDRIEELTRKLDEMAKRLTDLESELQAQRSAAGQGVSS